MIQTPRKALFIAAMSVCALGSSALAQAPAWQTDTAPTASNPLMAPASTTAPTPTQAGGEPADQAPARPAPASGPVHPGESLHLTQKAWEHPRQNMGPDQVAPGVKRVTWNDQAILPVNTREGLPPTVLMPPKETIQQIMVSDPGSFESVPSPDKHAFVVKPIYPGIDGNIVVFGSSGKSYNFYLKSTPYDDKYLPDVRVMVQAAGMGGESDDVPYPTGGGYGATGASDRRYGYANTAAGKLPGGTPDDPSAALTTSRAANARTGKDFAAVARTGPGRLRTDLRIMVSSEADSIIAPVAAWRDDKFTYLDFGPRAASMNTWPVAALVVDRVESPVGTRVAGPNRSIMVVESLGDIVLRNGEHVVCIKLDAEEHDPRHPVVEEPYRDRPGLVSPAPRLAEGTLHADLASTDTRSDARPATFVTTGPYDMEKALVLASDIVRGYRGKVHDGDIDIETISGRTLSRDEIAAAPAGKYAVRIHAPDSAFAHRVCSDLTYSHRRCRLD